MKRVEFIQILSLLSLSGIAMELNALNQLSDSFGYTEKMPVLVLSHGSPELAKELAALRKKG
jgi:hypothetical protein